MNALALAASLAVSTFTAHHREADACEKIRSVRELAQQERLDTRTLDALENHYCGDGDERPAPASISGDCGDLTLMLQLARMGGDPSQLDKIEAQRAAS